jgi:assimilatory nitrate reductase catalytic subunit
VNVGVSKVNPAVLLPANTSRLRHLPRLGRKPGIREELYPIWKSSRDAYQEWQRVSAGRTRRE